MTNLPEIFKGSWNNAQKIISQKGVGQAPGVQNARVVISTTSAQLHQVSVTNKNYPVKCDCERYIDLGLCAHILAVAFEEGNLESVIGNYKPNISTIVRPSGKPGKKPNRWSTRHRGI